MIALTPHARSMMPSWMQDMDTRTVLAMLCELREEDDLPSLAELGVAPVSDRD